MRVLYKIVLIICLAFCSTFFCFAEDDTTSQQNETASSPSEPNQSDDNDIDDVNDDLSEQTEQIIFTDPSIAETKDFKSNDEEEPEDEIGATKEKRLYWFSTLPEKEDHTYYHTVLVANSRSSEHGIVVNNLSAQTAYEMNCAYADIIAGIQQTENSNSFSLNGIYWFLRFYHKLPDIRIKYRLGTTFIYNFQWMNNVSMQNNLYAGFNSEMAFGKHVVCNTTVLYGAKFSRIFSLADSIPFIFNNDLGFNFVCSVRLPYRITAMFTFSTYEDFYYPLFCAPTFIFGLSYTSKNRFYIMGEVAARYTDMFTLSSYLDCYWFRITAGYTFK